MLVNQQNILSIIPQRPPFVMVDNLIDINEKGTYTSFLIKGDNVLVDKEKFSEAGLMENIAQTAAAGAGYAMRQSDEEVAIGYIGAVKNLEITALPNVGDVIYTSISVINNIFGVTIVSGEITCNSSILVKCEMKIFTKQ